MNKLAFYERDACIDDNTPLEGRVYCLDGHPDERNSERGLSVGVGLPSCHCCDCFVVGKEEIVFIEIKELLKEKEDDDAYFGRLLENAIKQMYGGMAVLGRFALRADDDDRKTLNREYYSFLMVLHGEDSINFRALTNREIDLYDRLHSLFSDTLNKVRIIFPPRLEEEIKRAIYPQQPSSAAA